MQIKTRMNVVLCATAVAAIVTTGAILHHYVREQTFQELRSEARLHMQAAQAVRSYTTDHVRELLLKDAGNFHPASVPSFAAVTTLRYLYQHYPGRAYEEVALNPTNPANRAQGWQVELIQEFRASRAPSLERMTGGPGQEVLHFARPIQVSDASCLLCHGKPEGAPHAVRAKYGSEHGYGWRIGETVGAQIVSVPVAVPLNRAREAFWQYIIGSSVVFGMVFMALNVMLRRVVINPIQVHQAALTRLATEDSLTGAANRRSFVDRLRASLEVAGQTGAPMSALMFDLDHFKRINDTHGHAAGDGVLKEVARRVKHELRPDDVLGRLGGEEFAVMLPNTRAADAQLLACRLLEAISNEPFEHAGTVSASFGVVQWDGEESHDDLLERADRALYEAKRGGRARVVMHEEGT